MRMLNEQSKVGAAVRAAEGRHGKGEEKGTTQSHTATALKRWNMHIKCKGLPSGEEIAGAAEQATPDILQANTSPQRGETIHAFGDGATWPKEGITGWGIQLRRGGGEALEEARGRTPGIHQNDGLGAYAILQSLLRTHTTGDIELYCNNQGCVNNWDTCRAVEKQGSRETR